ncbi:ATP-grasp domain-containing protein [Pinisolibacter sp. B13]|uniref:ATP-grasp domain-containing protein n=1 Tax=Pinisolibacter aquiterrae TaxID=2815579 RepID=UPI001C3C922A|nr:ATP-grasp domain-containing protein [Pinisolibacter aquiterrae]MBV5265062.1 ATP-grasp domain-containing protein [Pinisolibacter aquiterrae]
MDRKKVMFTGGGGAAAEAIRRLWADRYDLYFADADVGAIDASIPESARVAIPFARDPSFVPTMIETVRRLDIDVLVPGVDEELSPLAEARDAFAPCLVLGPPADFVAAHLDKRVSMDLLHRAGLTAPQTVPLSAATSLSAPFVAKPRSGRGSRGVAVLATADHIPAYLTLNGFAAENVIAQERIVGQEFTVFVAVDAAGVLRAVAPVKVLIKRGITIAAEIDPDPVVIDYVKRFHAAYPTPGIYNVQLMLRDGVAYPFEINPRVSTTFCLVIATGYDPIADFARTDERPMFVPRQRHTLRRNWFNNIGVQ